MLLEGKLSSHCDGICVSYLYLDHGMHLVLCMRDGVRINQKAFDSTFWARDLDDSCLARKEIWSIRRGCVHACTSRNTAIIISAALLSRGLPKSEKLESLATALQLQGWGEIRHDLYKGHVSLSTTLNCQSGKVAQEAASSASIR